MRCLQSKWLLSIPAIIGLMLGICSAQNEEPESFRWLASGGETSGVMFETDKLQPISLQGNDDPSVEIEQEEVKVDAQTKRIIRQAYSRSLGEKRLLIETAVEEIKKLPGDRIRAMRTISRRDINGRLTPVQQEIQEVTPAGAESFQIRKTLLLPGFNNSLVEKERVQQIERRRGEALVEIERIRYVAGSDAAWTTAERRVSQSNLERDRTQTEERVFEYGVNNRPSLTQQIKVVEWKDSSGRRQWQSETFMPNIEGKFQLDSRMTVIQSPLRDGRQETTEILEKISPATPAEGLKPARRIVENLTFIDANETRRELEVLEPDLNGRWRTFHRRQTIELK